MRPWVPGDEHWFCYLVGTCWKESPATQRARATLLSTSALPGTPRKTVEDRNLLQCWRILHLSFWENLCCFWVKIIHTLHVHKFENIIVQFLIFCKVSPAIFQLLLHLPLLPSKMLSSTAMSKQSDGVSSATGSQQCYNVQVYKQYHISSIFLLKDSSRACVYPGSKHGCEEALCPGRFLFLHQTEHFLPTIWNPHIFPHFSHTNLNISPHISSPIPPHISSYFFHINLTIPPQNFISQVSLTSRWADNIKTTRILAHKLSACLLYAAFLDSLSNFCEFKWVTNPSTMSGLDLAAGLSPMVKAFLAGSMSGTCSTLLFQVFFTPICKS